MTTTPTSGAADLPEALRRSTAADGKTELFNLPGYPLMVRAVDFNRIHTESEMRRTALLDEMQNAALAAGQATAAQQGVAYAELPEYGINTASHAHFRVLGFTADQMRAFADATHMLRASHGQAPAKTGNSVSAQAWSVPAIQGEMNVQLDIDSNHSAPGQQRDVARSVALGQPVGNGSDQVAGHPSAQGDKLLTVADRNIRSFLRSATFKSESDREAALNCVDVLWAAARDPADSVQEDAAREAIEKVLALFPFNALIQKFSVNNGPCLTADNDDEFYSVKRVLAFLTEIKTTLDAARKQGASHDR